MRLKTVIATMLLIVCLILIAGCTGSTATKSAATITATTTVSNTGNQAALEKAYLMETYIASTDSNMKESISSRDFVNMGRNAVLQRDYIDKNLPEMRQLANDATNKKAALLQFVVFLEDARNVSDILARAANYYKSGDASTGNRILDEEAIAAIDKELIDYDQYHALLKI